MYEPDSIDPEIPVKQDQIKPYHQPVTTAQDTTRSNDLLQLVLEKTSIDPPINVDDVKNGITETMKPASCTQELEQIGISPSLPKKVQLLSQEEQIEERKPHLPEKGPNDEQADDLKSHQTGIIKPISCTKEPEQTGISSYLPRKLIYYLSKGKLRRGSYAYLSKARMMSILMT